MIQGVPAVQPGFFLNVIRIQNTQNGRITVPVAPAHSAYARFKHIQGVPSRNGGLPMFKLRVLDNLIDRLLRYGEEVPGADELRRLGGEAVDRLIHDLENRLQQRVLHFPSSFGGFYPETGMLIDLIA